MTEVHKAVERRYRRLRVLLGPEVRRALVQQPLMDEGYALAINATQNVLREAMEAAFRSALPQPREYFEEMAVRLACYALTALHPDNQETGAMRVGAALLNKLADMQANGHMIKTEWER